MAGAVPPDEELYAHSEGGDASEDERNAALSPADGYFGAAPSHRHAAGEAELDSRLAGQGPMFANVPHVPNVMVEDPTLRQDAAEAKAREVAEEASSANAREEQPVSEPVSDDIASESQQHNTASTSPVTEADQDAPPAQPPTSSTGPAEVPSVQPHERRQSAAQRTQLVQPNGHHPYSDAPPAYTPRPPASYGAIASASSPRSPPPQAVPTPDEQQPLLPAPPQSMASPFPEPIMPTPPWRLSSLTAGRKRLRKKTVLFLAAFVAAITIVVVICGYLIGLNHQKHDFVEEPVKPPGRSHGDMQWRPPQHCRQAISDLVSVGQSYHFNADGNLTILQLFDDAAVVPGGRPVHVFGDVVLRPATDTSPSGYIAIESIANAKGLGFSLKLVGETLKVTAPQEITWQGDLDPCMQLRITLFVPPGAQLGNLDIQAQQLDVKIEKGLVMGVTKATQFLTLTGDIISPDRVANQSLAPYRLETPGMYLQSINGQVNGWYPLYEILDIQVSYGNIVTTVSQKLLKSGYPRPSKLSASTIHGHIDVQELGQSLSKDTIPRDHIVDIRTESGNIHAETLYSSSALVKSASGNLNLSITPALRSDCVKWGHRFCTVDTHTSTGTTYVVINPSFDHPDGNPGGELTTPGDKVDDGYMQYGSPANVSGLQSRHSSQHGDIVAMYPPSWEGQIFASTLSGNMDYTGKGLVMKYCDAINMRMRGRKGDGDSVMMVYSKSGDQKVVMGPL